MIIKKETKVGRWEMIYFTSDLHMGHEAVIRMQNRPFVNADDMNRVLIENYNSVVHKDDTVYLLGDVCFRIGVEKANELIASLKGKKYLIRGNHDKKYDESLFEDIRDFMTISVNGLHISLMHYPMLSWPRSHYGSIMLHGHIHSDMSYNISNREAGIKRYDVGVDANDYMPVSIKQIEDFLNSKEQFDEEKS
jgi:calcineurin-like phosphoesterase family protein